VKERWAIAIITIVAANVATVVGGTYDREKVAGETITAGQAVYLKAADGRAWLSQCDGNTEEDDFYGIALNGAAAGQPVVIQTGGQITIGGTVAIGTVYAVAAAAGGIAPLTDIVSTNKVSLIGYGATATILTIAKVNAGVAIP
jgi:predicted transcriptional regulator